MTREEAIKALRETYCGNKVFCELFKVDLCRTTDCEIYHAIKALDAEPVKHGRWEQVEVVHDRKDAKIQDWQQAKCSVCGRWNTTPFMYYLKLDNYCPNCGAHMMDEVENG